MLCVEYRTILDEARQKHTAEHYRRYIDPAAFLARLKDKNLTSLYASEGTGYAKYKNIKMMMHIFLATSLK